MNWRRGILLAAINLAVALPPVIWLEHTEAAYLRDYEHDAAKQANTESPVVAPNQTATTSDGGVTFTIDPCSIVDGSPPQQQVVILANFPAEVLADWGDFCPARWTLSGMLHAGGWWAAPSATTMAAQRKADIGFLLLIAIQWFLVGGFPLRQPKRPWGEPGMFITVCAVIAVVLVFIHPVEGLARLPGLCAVFAWLWWFGLLVWKAIRSTARLIRRTRTA